MLLNDIGKSPDTTFKKINQHLEANYGFRIAEDASDRDLVAIMEQIEDEINDLKIRGNDAKGSSEISKRLLVLEGIKTLREFAILQFQSPDLENVVNGMCDFVCDNFRISGMSHADFEDSVRDAMKHYRSSKYRFPDNMIEDRTRQSALSRIQQMSNSTSEVDDTGSMEEEMQGIDFMNEDDPWGSVGKRASATGGHVPSRLDAKQRQTLQKLGLEAPSEEEPVAMVRDRHGRMVPDPFAKQKQNRMKGIVGVAMETKENLVKNLRRLLETEVSQAEVMMAAKGFAQELQEMIEKIGRLQNEDLPPVTDQMRETYGMESSSAFQTQIYGALQGVMDSLYTAKGQVDDAVSNMALTGQVSAQTDMDLPIDGMDAGPNDVDADLDNIEGDLDAGDEFGGAAEEDPLGRAMKTESLQMKVLEMQRLVGKARKLREARA